MPRQSFPRRRRFFIGAEGESERSFARWLRRLCDELGINVYFDIYACRGGDSLTIVTYSLNQYRRRSRQFGRFSAGLILVDADRIKQDKLHGRDPHINLIDEKLSLVQLTPNFEGLLWRLHSGNENRFIAADRSEQSLKKRWPEYAKPTSAEKLHRRFKLQDLQRVAQHDADIRLVMETLRLPL